MGLCAGIESSLLVTVRSQIAFSVVSGTASLIRVLFSGANSASMQLVTPANSARFHWRSSALTVDGGTAISITFATPSLCPTYCDGLDSPYRVHDADAETTPEISAASGAAHAASVAAGAARAAARRSFWPAYWANNSGACAGGMDGYEDDVLTVTRSAGLSTSLSGIVKTRTQTSELSFSRSLRSELTLSLSPPDSLSRSLHRRRVYRSASISNNGKSLSVSSPHSGSQSLAVTLTLSGEMSLTATRLLHSMSASRRTLATVSADAKHSASASQLLTGSSAISYSFSSPNTATSSLIFSPSALRRLPSASTEQSADPSPTAFLAATRTRRVAVGRRRWRRARLRMRLALWPSLA